MKVELEFPHADGGDQGIDHLVFTSKDGDLFVEGWYDSIAMWGASVTLSPDDRRALAEALLTDLPETP